MVITDAARGNVRKDRIWEEQKSEKETQRVCSALPSGHHSPKSYVWARDHVTHADKRPQKSSSWISVAVFQLGLAFSCLSHESANCGTCKSSSEEMLLLRGSGAGRRGTLGHQGLPLGKIAFSVTSFLFEVLFSFFFFFLTDQWETHFSKNCLV